MYDSVIKHKYFGFKYYIKSKIFGSNNNIRSRVLNLAIMFSARSRHKSSMVARYKRESVNFVRPGCGFDIPVRYKVYGLALPQAMAAKPKLFGSSIVIRHKSLESRFKELKTFPIIFIYVLHLKKIDINIVGHKPIYLLQV